MRPAQTALHVTLAAVVLAAATATRPSRAAPIPTYAEGVPSLAPESPAPREPASPAPREPATPEPRGGVPVLVATPLDGDIQIDGKLDEPAWSTATPAAGFRQLDPDEGALASNATDVRVLFDEDAIYVGARCVETDPSALVARLARRDLTVESDAFEVALDSEHDRLTAAVFGVTAAGAIRDALLRSDGVRDDSWDPVWSAATSRDAAGWSAEFRIPLSQLRVNRGGDGRWGIQLTRYSSRRQETDVFAFTPKRESAGVNRYALLTGLGAVRPQRSLELIPYLSSRLEYLGRGNGDPFHPAGDVGAKAGLDLRSRLGGGLNLDATIRPDFGQVEADPALVDLSGFETFYPEKRPFFIQGADLFRFGDMRGTKKFDGGQPFHSRRIGRSPQGSVTDPEAAWVDQPAETPIDAATRITGHVTPRWSLGVLDAVTGKAGARYVDGSGAHGETTVEPPTNYFAARGRRESADGNTLIGGIVTAVHRDLETPELRALLRDRAVQAGVDLSRSWGNRRWGFDASFAATSIRGSEAAIARAQRTVVHYLQRPDRRGLRYDPARTSLDGYQAQMAVSKLSGLHWLGSLSYQQASPGFEPNDLGFTTRADFRRGSAYLAYKEDRPASGLRRWTGYVYTRPAWTYDGILAYAQSGGGLKTLFHNYWSLDLDARYLAQVHDDRTAFGGPLVETPACVGLTATVSSDARRSWQIGSTVYRVWDHEGYDDFQVSAFAEYRPTSALRLRAEPAAQRFFNFVEFVTAQTDPTATRTYGRRYVFAPLTQNSLSLIGRVDWTLTPEFTVQLFAQPFVSSARFGRPMELERGSSYEFARYGVDRGTASGGQGSPWVVDPDGSGPASSFTVDDPTFGRRSLLSNFVVRWEYRPGSTVYLVWQQTRKSEDLNGEFSTPRGLRTLFGTHPDQVFLIKASWWFSP